MTSKKTRKPKKQDDNLPLKDVSFFDYTSERLNILHVYSNNQDFIIKGWIKNFKKTITHVPLDTCMRQVYIFYCDQNKLNSLSEGLKNVNKGSKIMAEIKNGEDACRFSLEWGAGLLNKAKLCNDNRVLASIKEKTGDQNNRKKMPETMEVFNILINSIKNIRTKLFDGNNDNNQRLVYNDENIDKIARNLGYDEAKVKDSKWSYTYNKVKQLPTSEKKQMQDQIANIICSISKDIIDQEMNELRSRVIKIRVIKSQVIEKEFSRDKDQESNVKNLNLADENYTQNILKSIFKCFNFCSCFKS